MTGKSIVERPSTYRQRRQRAIGIVVFAVLIAADAVWIWFDRDACAYPEVPAAYRRFVARHEQAESTLPLVWERLRKAGYGFRITGEDTIEGRKATVVALKSRIRNRPWRLLWVDRQTRRVLAMRDLNSASKIKRNVRGPGCCNGVLSESMWNAVIRGASASASDSADQNPSGAADRLGSVHIDKARRLPRGFELVGTRNCGDGWRHTVYSNGLNAISFFERFPGTPGREHKSRIGVYSWGSGLMFVGFRAGAEVIVIGDLPADELQAAAGS